MYNTSRNFSNGNFNRSSRPAFNRSGFSGNRLRKNTARKQRGETIDVSRFVSKASSQPVTLAKTEHSFDDFAFVDQIKTNLRDQGFTTPTPIQDKSISHIIEGRDIIGLANTGTGKTAAFLLPLINWCTTNRQSKVLIIAPTRELAQQIDVEFKKFSLKMNLYSSVCVGGIPIYKQISSLRRGSNFVIGTPGRLKDLKDRGSINFSNFDKIVLDEIDRMLDMGFVVEIKKILSELPENRQSLFFSATLPPKISSLVQQFLKNPITVQASSGVTAKNIDQDIVRVTSNDKFGQLKDLLIKDELKKVLIFSETKRDVERLTDDLVRDGFKADSIHGDKRQTQRQKALLSFRQNELQILVATDVAARGLDIKNVTHVINYTVPQTYDDYIHRIGRTGRADQKGFALTFVG